MNDPKKDRQRKVYWWREGGRESLTEIQTVRQRETLTEGIEDSMSQTD